MKWDYGPKIQEYIKSRCAFCGVREKFHGKLTSFQSNKCRLLYVVNQQQKERSVHSRIWKSLVNNHHIRNWNGFIARKVHEEHDDTYYDHPNTLFLNEFAFKSQS